MWPSFYYRFVEESWLLFKNALCALADNYVPLVSRTNDRLDPWFTVKLKRIRSKKKPLYNIAKSLRTSSSRQNYKCYFKTYSSALAEAKDKYFSNDLPELLKNNPAKFWKLISPNHGSHNICLHSSSNIPLPNSECLSALNSFFNSVFTDEDTSSVPYVSDWNHETYKYHNRGTAITHKITLGCLLLVA